MSNKPKPLPSTDELRRLFYVDDAGTLRWRVSRGNGKIHPGDIAGLKKPRRNRPTYRRVFVNGCRHYAQRIAYALHYGDCPVGLNVDHKDGNGLNNCKENLKLVTNQGNKRNGFRYSNNASGVTGVYWYKRRHLWMAQIRISGKLHHLGYFNTIEEAAAARKCAECEHGYSERHGSNRDTA